MEANQQPPPDTTNATPGLVGVSFMFAMALIAYGFRMRTRISPLFKLTATDHLISSALLCEVFVLVCLLTAIGYGLGRYDYYISATTLIKINKCLFLLGLFGFWASSLARVSIGYMLLRFEISKTWRMVLWILIFTQFAMAIGSDVFQLLQCRPIRAMWETVPDAVCWTAQISRSYGNGHSKRSSIRYYPISVLMGFGTVAAVAGAMKVYHIDAYDPRKDVLRDWMPLLWWYRVEEIGLIIAACTPFLKPSIERLLARLGALPFRFVTIGLNLFALITEIKQ
ncbi:hypothetical protein G7Y89_g4824 [Cudoniella acicularis]|uniref:Rhodopsin domain-containing protein n=1 Tax=Cudoniella acicularis TaxID=354080 RepID=A0A8H4RNN3_9HELO|nr:hypothetical protein G7Y89_g4824 [Cudoniella acicularis]